MGDHGSIGFRLEVKLSLYLIMLSEGCLHSLFTKISSVTVKEQLLGEIKKFVP